MTGLSINMMAERQSPSKRIRIAISILLLGHLLAVFLPPLSLQTRGPLGQSPSVATLFAPLEAYSQFLYIDRGYAFFAPEPGPSHLVQAAVTGGDGQQMELMFPDREEQWPRLLYHRHFMLTEFLDTIYQAPGPPPELVELDRDAAEFWIRNRARYEHVRQSVVEHLEHEYPGQKVAIRRVEHLIPDLFDYQQEPIELTDPRLYQVILDQPIESDPGGDLMAPTGPPETIPPPDGAAIEPDSDAADAGTVDSPSEPVSDDAKANVEPADDGETREPVQSNAGGASP